MATYTAVSAKHQTLGAATVDTVTLSLNSERLQVVNRDGAADIYFTVDGSVPTVGGDDCYVVPAVAGASLTVPALGTDVVKLISSGTPKYTVQEFGKG